MDWRRSRHFCHVQFLSCLAWRAFVITHPSLQMGWLLSVSIYPRLSCVRVRNTDVARNKRKRTAVGGTLGGGMTNGGAGKEGVGADTTTGCCAVSGRVPPNLSVSVPGGASCETCTVAPAVERIKSPLRRRTGQRATRPSRKVDLLLHHRDGLSKNKGAKGNTSE